MLSAPSLIGCLRTFATSARAVLAESRVGLIVGVALWAMCSCQHALASVSPANVFKSRDWFQMFRVDAAANSAQMVQLQTGRNGATEHRVCSTVGFKHCSADPKASVSKMIEISSPDPAAAFGDDLNMAHESFFDGLESVLVVSHRASILSSRLGRGKNHEY